MKLKKKLSNLQLNLFVIFSLVFISSLYIVAYIIYQNKVNLISFLFPPNPKVISTECEKNDMGWIDIGINVKVTIQNNGGGGKLRVNTYVIDGVKTYQKSFDVYIDNFETRDFLVPFDEVLIFVEELICKADVKVIY
jgi:hypothetical protein